MIQLLVNLNYNLHDGDQGHIIYQIPYDKNEDAQKCVQEAYQEWLNDSIESIEEIIENIFKKNNIPFEPQTYDVINLDMFNC